jgi:hypothetical protein
MPLSSAICHHVQLTTVCGYVYLTGKCITSHATAELVSSELPTEVKQVHVFNEQDLTEYSLLSVSKLCKAGLHVVFTDSSVNAYDSTIPLVYMGTKIHTQVYPWCDCLPLRVTH